MIEVKLSSPTLSKSIHKKIPSLLKRTAHRLSYLANLEALKQMPQRFKMRRPWIAKGFRNEIVSNSTNLVLAVAYHRDRFMRKQEDGGVLKPRRKYLLLSPDLQPSRWRRNLLAQKDYFADSQGIWQRKGNSRRLRYWFKERFQYDERFEYEKTAREVVRREAARI
jgi:hypothetical protein